MRARGYQPIVLEGRGPDFTENSLLVPGLKTLDAIELGRKYGQSSVIGSEGLIDVTTGVAKPIVDTIYGEEARTQPYHSIAKIQGREIPFSMEFGEAAPPVAEPFTGYHMAAKPVEGEILRGARRGESRIGEERARLAEGGAPEGVYVYREGAKPEAGVASRPVRAEVAGKLGKYAIADILNNPIAIAAREQAKAEGRNPHNAAEAALKAAGFDAYENPNYPGSVFVFGDVPIRAQGPRKATAPELMEQALKPKLLPKPVRAKGDWFARAVGPQQVGGTYQSGYWGKKYEVLSIKKGEGNQFSIKIRWEDGEVSEHATPWDYKRDKVVSQPEAVPAIQAVIPVGKKYAMPTAKKGFFEEGFKRSFEFEVRFPNQEAFVDEIKGLNEGHARWRAMQNWAGAEVRFTKETTAVPTPAIQTSLSLIPGGIRSVEGGDAIAAAKQIPSSVKRFAREMGVSKFILLPHASPAQGILISPEWMKAAGKSAYKDWNEFRLSDESMAPILTSVAQSGRSVMLINPLRAQAKGRLENVILHETGHRVINFIYPSLQTRGKISRVRAPEATALAAVTDTRIAGRLTELTAESFARIMAGEEKLLPGETGKVTRALLQRAKTPTVRQLPAFAGRIQEFLDRSERDARGRLRGLTKGTVLPEGTQLGAEVLTDLTIVGAAKIWRGTRSFDAWANEMVKEYGEAIRPRLPEIWRSGKAFLQDRVTQNVEGKLTSPAEIQKLIKSGEHAKDWYESKEYMDVAKRLFGEDEPVFTGFLAATSQSMNVHGNVEMALKAYAQWKTGTPFEKLFLARKNVERIALGEEPSGPKIKEFLASLKGSGPGPIDRWVARGFLDQERVTPVQRQFIHAAMRELAQQMKLEPRQVQAMLWAGVKKDFLERGLTRAGTDSSFGRLLESKFNQAGKNLFGEELIPAPSRGFEPGPATARRGLTGGFERVGRDATLSDLGMSANPVFNPRAWEYLDAKARPFIDEKIVKPISRAIGELPPWLSTLLRDEPNVKLAVFKARAEFSVRMNEAEALIKMVRRAKLSPEEILIADRLARGVPADINQLRAEIRGPIAKATEKLHRLAQEMTSEFNALGLPIREEWIEGPKHWYPNLWKQHEVVTARMVLGRLFSKGGRALGLTAAERGSLKQRLTDRYVILDESGDVVRLGKTQYAIFKDKAVAEKFLRENSGYYARYYLKGGDRAIQERYFPTIKEREAYLEALEKQDMLGVVRTKGREAMTLMEPMTHEQAVAHGLLEDVTTNIKRGYLPRFSMLAKAKALEHLGKNLAVEQPRAGYVESNKYGFEVEPKLAKGNPDIARLRDGYVPEEAARTLAAFYGKRGLFSQWYSFVEGVPRSLVTFLSPFRHVRQVFENELSLVLADTAASLNKPAQAVAFRDYLRGTWSGKEVPFLKEYLREGYGDTDIIGGEFRDIWRGLEQASAGKFPLSITESISEFLGKNPTAIKITEGRDFMQKLYRTGDQIYKYYLYRTLRERGMTSEQIAKRKLVRRAFFDFEDVPPLVRAANRVVPFMVNVLYQYARILGHHLADALPSTLLKLGLLGTLYVEMRDAVQEASGFDDRKIKSLHDEAPDASEWILPVTDKYGRNIVLNMRWLIPFADILWMKDIATEGEPGKAGTQFLRKFFPMSAQPILTAISGMTAQGKELFTGAEPRKGLKNLAKVYGTRFGYAALEYLPMLAGQYWKGLYDNATQRGPRTQVSALEKAVIRPLAGSTRRIGTVETYDKLNRAASGETIKTIETLARARRQYEDGKISSKAYRSAVESFHDRAVEVMAMPMDATVYNKTRKQLERTYRRAMLARQKGVPLLDVPGMESVIQGEDENEK